MAPLNLLGKIIFGFLLVSSQIIPTAAFEAHIVNVTAHICDFSQTRTMGFWKTHPEVYLPLLPQFLGATPTDEIITSQAEVNQVFLDYRLSMRNKLKGQLLAMKLNVAYFGIGDYADASTSPKTLNDIAADADNLLRNAGAADPALEEMKGLLDYLNNLHQIRSCSSAAPLGPEPKAGAVINEFLPNPVGDDKAQKPNGEWIEIYNNGAENIDAAGWLLYDENDNHELAITNANTDSGTTIIPAFGFLVVYRDGDPDFSLNNTGGDAVRLYNGEIGAGVLVDSYTYGVDAPEGKSFARIPDGSENWVDPLPTPGETNVLEQEEAIFGPAIPESDETLENAESPIITTQETADAAAAEEISPPNEEPAPIEPATAAEETTTLAEGITAAIESTETTTEETLASEKLPVTAEEIIVEETASTATEPSAAEETSSAEQPEPADLTQTDASPANESTPPPVEGSIEPPVTEEQPAAAEEQPVVNENPSENNNGA